MKTEVIASPWHALRRYTPARIALGRSGASLPTGPQLEFRLAHARARDAVHRGLDVAALAADLQAIGLESIALESAAPDRATYLRRPDLGRMLDPASRKRLRAGAAAGPQRFDLAFVVADGLSALAVQRHACPLLADTVQCLRTSPAQWHIAPVAVVTQGRVAIGDEIGADLRAGLVVVLIGERPGLSSPDSLGIYLTWDPRPGRLDSQRNCISNVRPEGLPCAVAAQRLCRLLEEARRRRVTGIELKDDSDPALSAAEPRRNFLIAGGGISSGPSAD
ncbi:MAG: ethanolamine ammonia-lyase subunit EutC [Limnobacter sp.]|nr:ethanolamine ammonia-lyase subunit EutC [Limnobacter sp.]